MDQRIAFTSENMCRLILESLRSKTTKGAHAFLDINNRTMLRLLRGRVKRLDVLFYMAGKCGIQVLVEGSPCPDLDFFTEKLEEVRVEKGMKKAEFYGTGHRNRCRHKMLRNVKADIELKPLFKKNV